MAKIIQVFVVLALALLVVQATSNMSINERRDIKNWVSHNLLTVQNKFGTLHDGTPSQKETNEILMKFDHGLVKLT